MQPKNEALYIEELVDAIERIIRYTSGGEGEFFSNPMIQDAVALNLIVIGEAAKNLSAETTARGPKTSWKQVAGMRDRLTHAYSATDTRVVWKVVAEDLEPLLEAAKKLRQ